MLRELDLSYLDTLIGVFMADELDAKFLEDLSADNFTLAMYRAGFLQEVTDASGIIIGFEFQPPQNFSMLVQGTVGDDNLATGNGDDFVIAGDGDDVVSAGSGVDYLSGGTGGDTLYGEDGSDQLYGGAGADALYGGAGEDILDGGFGKDELFGGGGADTFSFLLDEFLTGIDRIRDFSVGEGDKIDLSDLLSAYDPLIDDIRDFVLITDAGSSSLVAVDVNGGGDAFDNVALILDINGLTDEQALVDNGILIA